MSLPTLKGERVVEGVVQRDSLAPAASQVRDLPPAPWDRLSRAECMLLAIAVHRSACDGLDAAFASTTQESFSADVGRMER